MLSTPTLARPSESGFDLPADQPIDRPRLLPARQRLDAKLQQLAALAGISTAQLFKSCLERATDALRQPASAGQLIDAADLAQQLEASLPEHAGTALRTRAALCLVLLDPPGSDRLALSLGYVRQVLGD